jgi:glycosyltransferase involved in cell wall biosynthesis
MKIVLLGPANIVHTRRWFYGLCEAGHQVVLVSQHPDDTLVCPPRGSIHYLPHRGTRGYFLNAPAFGKLLKNVQPYLVNAHYASGYGMLASIVRFRPTVLSVWGSDVYEFPYKRFPLNLCLMRWILGRNDQIASTSQAMAVQVKSLLPQVRDVAITPFGVDTDSFSPNIASKDDSYITIGTVKTLERTYGIDTMIVAFTRLWQDSDIIAAGLRRKLRLVIVGKGSERESLVALAKDLGVDACTTFVGPISHAEVPEWLSRFDIYIAISRRESFGVAVIEASSCGIPVIVSDRGGLPEVVDPDVTGFVVPAEDADAVARQMKRLVLNDDLRRQIGAAGRQYVMQNYEWRASIEKMTACFEVVISRTRADSA